MNHHHNYQLSNLIDDDPFDYVSNVTFSQIE